MAEKKNWRDYSKTYSTEDQTEESTDKASDNKKTGGWRDYSSRYSDEESTNGYSASSWRNYSNTDFAAIAGESVVNRVNNWLSSHNNLLSSHQDRYSNRKFTYEDAYVGDSRAWLDKVNQERQRLNAEADSIIDDLYQNQKYLDADWMKEVINTLNKAREDQGQLSTYATQDFQMWSKWENEDAYKADVNAHKDYTEKVNLDTEAYAKEIEDFGNFYDEAVGIGHWYDLYKQGLHLQTDQAEIDRKLGVYNRYINEFGGDIYAVEKAYKAKEKYLNEAKQVQADAEEQKLYEMRLSFYKAYTNNPDFLEKSAYQSTYRGGEEYNAWAGMYTDTGYDDITYDYINRDETARGRMLVNDIATNAAFLGLDTSYLQEMTDDEIAIYNYLYQLNKPQADEYLQFLISDLTYRQRQRREAESAAYAKEHPFLASGFTVVTSPLKLLSAVGQFADYAADGTVDQNAGYNKFSYNSSAIRNQIASDIEKSGSWGKVGSWTYQLGMSMGDFLVNSAISGGNSAISLTLMGSGAMADTVISAKDRGLSDDQAMILGVVAGAAEIVTEKFSLDALFNGDLSKGAMRYILTNAFTEGTEEVSSSLINTVADVLVSKDKSEWEMAIKEYLAKNPNATESEAFEAVLGDKILSLGLDFLGGALMGGTMGSGGAAINYVTNARPGIKENKDAVTKYGDSTKELIEQGLLSDPNSDSYDLAKHYQKKTEKGKALSGYEIRNLVEANDAQFAVENFQSIAREAKSRLSNLGETDSVTYIADLVAKRVTGQELTRSEKSTLARSQFGAQVAKEMSTVTETESGKKSFDVSMKAPTYKSLEERVGNKVTFALSDNGQTTIRESGEAISLDNVEVVSIGKNDIALKVDGKEVNASDIDFADDNESHLFEAVSKIENITPGAATAIIRDYNPSSEQSVGEYLNGVDEAYTYGYYGYSVADLKAGNFAPNLTNEQMMSAYELGKSARKISGTNKAEAIKRMRTAAQAEAEKATAEGKKASTGKKLTITYNEGNGKVSSIEKAGELSEKQQAGVDVAKILHKLGLGTNFEFFTSYLSKTLKDKNGNPARVFINDNGVEEIAYSGVYRMKDGTIRIDLNAYGGRELTLNALSHELTHFIQQWSDEKYQVLVDFLMKTYEKTDMTMRERVLREQARLEGIRGEKVSYSEAYDEVVANAMSKMLDDGKLVERLTELKATDKKLAQKLWEGFKKILSKFLNIYQNENALFWDANDIMQVKDTFEQLQNMFAEAFVEASENFQASLTVAESQTLTEAGIGFDSETKSVYSLHFSNAYTEQIQVGKKNFDAEAIAQLVSKATSRSIEDARAWVKSEMAIANIVMQNPEFLDFEADNRYEAIKKNSDYPQGTVDLSNLCPKREEFTAMFDMLQKKYPNKLFTAQDVADMRKILSDNDITVACGACFVEDRRQLIGEIADTFIGMWKEAVETGEPLQKTNAAGSKVELQVTKALAKQYGLTAGTKIMATDTYIPNQYDLTTYEGFKLLEKNHPTIAMAFNRYNNSRGQQSARLIEGRAEYKRQILGWSDAKVRSVNNNGGLRIFSFSDFEVVHLLDLVQVIIDCAAKGVKIQGYTKIPAFAKLVSGTGIKLNRSLIPKGDYGYHMENGKVVLDYDTTEGIDINDKNFVDESANPDVGNIVIGINPTQIGAAMLDPFIDYIIPFHSNKAKEILRKLGTGEWVNYKESQHEKDIATGTSSKHNVNIYTEVINKYHPKNKVEFVEAFLKECKRQGKIPRYAEFLNVDANGDYAYREGYHKLLVDFKMFDAEGNILPQGNITPNLDEGFMTDLLKAEIDKKQNYEFPQEVYDAIDKKFGERYSSQETDIDTDQKVTYHKGKTQEVNGNERREETREDFHRRAVQEGCTVYDRGEVAYAFRPVTDRNLGESIRRAERNLREKGIQVIVCDLFEVNRDGITTQMLEGISVAGEAVYLMTSMDADPIEVAEHEAYHFWKHTRERMDYFAELYKNFDFDSPAAIDLLSKIEKAYIESQKANVKTDVEVDSDESVQLIEEAFAFVTGFVASGDKLGIAHNILRDFDAVKDAWDDLIKKRSASVDGRTMYSSQETDIDPDGKQIVTYKDAIANLSKYSYADLRSIADQLTDGTYSFAKNMSRESMENVLRNTLAILAKEDPTQTVQVSYTETPSAANVSQGKLNTAKNSKKELVLKLRELHQEIGDRNKSMNNVAQYINGVQKLWDQLGKGEITAQQYDEQLRGKSPYYRELFNQAQKLQKDFDGLVKELEEIEGKPWKSLRSDVLYGSEYRYSGHETDNISNRDLLANAFEGITQNSNEYKLIQEYKNRIKLLNEQEAKLAELNAEIRKIRFGKDVERDAAKLRQLEAEAKNTAQAINRQDKKLLSLEASEPLRKVIERERKKEAQKTKDHVKEIQQNKKVRAEQTELRHKIRKAIRDLDKLLNRGNKKLNVKEDMKGFVSKALELADYLFTDHVSNDDLIRKGINPGLVAASGKAQLLHETEDILTKLYDEADSLTDEEFTKLDAKRKANEDKLRDLLTAQRNERLSTPVYNLFNDLVTEYASLKNSNQDAVKAAYNDVVEQHLRTFLGDADSDRAKALQNMRVADMTTEELWKLYNAYTMVLTTVRDANKFHVKGMTETIEQMAGRIANDFSSRKIPDKKLAIAMQKLANKIGWDYEKLYYALDRIGSEAFTELIMNIANSENIVMQDIIEAAEFRDQIVEKYGFNNWDVNKKIDREFLDNTGKKFKLTLGELMSLYAYSRREGAWDHIEYGGFAFGKNELTNPKPADTYKLSKEQCEAITSLLTKEQKGYVEDMQKFLSETMGAKGNEVSMQLYGIKMFGEKNYFPLHVYGAFKAQAQESQAKAAEGFTSMSNAGFTHAQNPNAKAPFVLEGFNEVWSDHVNEMSRYHGTVPALEDLRRVMNRSTYSDATSESTSIKQLMINAYGEEAAQYFDNLYREANSGAITDKLQRVPKKLLSLFRKNSVAYSLSVLIQQPTSIIRAYAMIPKRYFGIKGFGTITSGVIKAVGDKWTKAHTNAYNEMLKYAPGVTMAKEIGGFDTHTGGSIRSYLLDTNKSLKQKWETGTKTEKGKALLDAVDDNAIANLPNMADKIAWIEIWNACKRETVAKHKDLATNSEEFMQIVGDRFTEVIRATQVYDSIFAKSPMLKSKNLVVQYLTSFMNEPNTVANMAESAVRDAIRGDWKGGAKKAVVLVYGTLAVGVMKSLIYALRDDDEDETYAEKYIESLVESLVSDFNPLSYIPVIRDVSSALQGYDIERPDMAIIVDAIEALEAAYNNANKDTEDMTEAQLAELEKKMDEATWDVVGSVAAFFGIPVKNIRRDFNAIFTNKSANAGLSTKLSLSHTIEAALNDSKYFFLRDEGKSQQDKLYEAILAGDTTYVNRLKATYVDKHGNFDQPKYDTAVRKALRENDSRIHTAAQARYDGNTEEYKRIFREIQSEGKFSFDDIMSAINSEESKIRNGGEPDKVTSDYTASGFVQAVITGNTSNAQAMKEDIISAKVANGKTRAEAEKEFQSSVQSAVGDAYSAGLLDEARAEKMLKEYAGKDEEEAASKVNYWSFINAQPQYKSVLSEANVNDYQEFAEPANISLDVFVQYINGTKGLETKYDEWGDAVESKRDQVLAVIDSLPLTWQQKDALYLAAGYSESKIWDVPW